MKKHFLNFTTATIVILGISLPKSWAGNMQTHLRIQGDTLNFEVSGQKNWDYDLKRIQDGKSVKVQLQVKGLDEGSTRNLKSIQNPFVKGIKVLPKAVDGFTVIEFYLTNDSIDAFDYLTDQPSKLVVDFYKNDERLKSAQTNDTDSGDGISGKNATDKNGDKVKKAGSNPGKLAADKKYQSPSRYPADVNALKIEEENGILTFVQQDIDLKSGLFDGGDEKFHRFKIKGIEIRKNAIIKGLANYYLRFPMLSHEMNFWTAMKNNPPDYEISQGTGEENKQAHLLKVLFDRKRTLVLKKTSDWFEKKFPYSKHLEQVYYMNADSHIQTWRETGDAKYFDDGMQFYAKAMTRFSSSKLNERTSLLLGFLNLDKKDYLTAIRKLSAHVENTDYKGRPSQEYAKLGLALAMLNANKLEDGLALLDDVEKTTKNEMTRAEAAYRRGDFYFHQNKYTEAVDAFDTAFKKYPNQTQLFPNSHFNRMEALFRLKKPELSHAEGLEFVQRYPAHEYAPYALTRVGELLEILGADQSKSVGAYLETHFRYGDNPKTVVPRLHLLSTRMKVMKPQEVKETIAKMNELAEQSQLEDIQQFKTTMVADGYSRRKEYDKAIEILTQFYQKEPNKPDSFQVTLRIMRNINDQMKEYSSKDDFQNVLKTYKRFADTWLKAQPRIDTNFYVAKAYQSAGSYNTALKQYDKLRKQVGLLKDDAVSIAIRASQDIPTEDVINLMQAQCLYEENRYQEAYEKMQGIKNPEALSVQDQINRVHYTALLYEKKGELNAAVRYLSELSKVWKDKAELLAPSTIHLANLEIKRKQPESAIENLTELLNSKVSDKYKLEAYKKLSDIALSEKKTELAIKTLSNLLSNFENKENLSSYRYKLGELYFNQGELKKAENAWSELKGNEASFWSQLAQNKLRDSNWSEENKKYLKRIPAMSKSEKAEDSK
ncbi:MAG: tetratricopeptide repeat protein [Bdellovibrionota bacterium]